MRPTKNIIQGSGLEVRARARDHSRNVLTAADVVSAAWKTFDVSDGTQLGSGDLDKDAVIDELSVVDWPFDDVGYNFRCVLPSSAFPEGDKTVQIEIHLVLVADEPDVIIGYEQLPQVRVTRAYWDE